MNRRAFLFASVAAGIAPALPAQPCVVSAARIDRQKAKALAHAENYGFIHHGTITGRWSSSRSAFNLSPGGINRGNLPRGTLVGYDLVEGERRLTAWMVK